MKDRKQALSMARVCRLCPPPAVAGDAAYRDEMERHLQICPYCESDGFHDDDPAPWNDFASALGALLFSDTLSGPVAPGHLCYLKKQRGRWHGGYYYNPPMVMVLDATPQVSDDILVAQVYHDTGLAGPGDLVLTETQRIGGGLFVESWNIYTLRMSDLGPAVDSVGGDVVQAVRNMDENPDDHPPWAPALQPFKEQDVRRYFREMEIEVGYTFSAPSVAALAEEAERNTPGIAYDDVRSLAADLHTLDAGIRWADDADTPEEVLFTAELPPESLSLAAADNGEREAGGWTPEVLVANVVYLAGGRVRKIVPADCQVMAKDESGGVFRVSGRIAGLPKGASGVRLFCVARDEKGHLRPAFTADLDMPEGWFLAEFKDYQGPVSDFAVTIMVEAS